MFLDLVKKRLSVRQYLEKPVDREILNRCLEAARLAPSACNSQPWYFIVIDDPKLKNQLAEAAFTGMYSMNSFAKQAPVLVVVVRESSKAVASLGGQLRGVSYNWIDLGIACEHFILQAADEGVGTCWLGWFDEGAVKKLLGIPRQQKADLMISVGYPEERASAVKLRKSLDEMSRFN